MSEETENAFRRVLKRKQKPTLKDIDGDRNFLFISPNGNPMQESNYKSVLNGVVKKYNKNHEKTPLLKITPHSLRHTFCTQLVQKNMNPKNLQYTMGHASITITLDLYAYASEAGANRELRKHDSMIYNDLYNYCEQKYKGL